MTYPRSSYRTYRWRKLSQLVKERDRHACQKCGGFGDEADHIVPRHAGGEFYDLANLQTLCRTCHIAKSRAELPTQTPGRADWIQLMHGRLN